MTPGRIWNLSIILFFACLITGRFATFTNGGNGNAVWYLLFWLFCTSLFFSSGLMLAKLLKLQKKLAILLLAVLTFAGFLCSNPIALMSLLGLPFLIPFSIFVVVLLLIVKTEKRLE